jgi:viroplasmin and RNaseH domain-containing protein
MAMVGMMESLAIVILEVQKEMKSLKTGKAVPITPVQPGKKESMAVPNKKKNASEETEDDLDYWYGLACGRGGVSGIYQSWGEVAPLVIGVSGLLVKKFRDYWQAEALVENYKKQKEDMGAKLDGYPEWWYAMARGRNGLANVYPSWAEASVQVIGVSGSIVKKFREFEEGMNFINHFQEVSPPATRGGNGAVAGLRLLS